MYSAGVLVRTDPHQLFNIARQNEIQNELISRGDRAIPFFHPSYEALIFAPFSLTSYRVSYHVFQAFNLVLILLCFLVGRRHFSVTVPFIQPRPGLMFFPFFPVFAACVGVQDSLVLLLILFLTTICLEEKRIALAGAVAALALFKFQIVLIVGILLAFRWKKRFALSFLATAAILALISVAITGLSGTEQFLEVLRQASLVHDQSEAAQSFFAIYPLAMVNLNALLFAAGTRYLSSHAAAVVVGAISFVLFVWCSRRVIDKRVDDGCAISIAILCGVLVSGHLYIHDVSLLLLPFALIGRQFPRLVLACYSLPVFAFLTGSANATFLVVIPVIVLILALLRKVPETKWSPGMP